MERIATEVEPDTDRPYRLTRALKIGERVGLVEPVARAEADEAEPHPAQRADAPALDRPGGEAAVAALGAAVLVMEPAGPIPSLRDYG